MRTRIIMLAGVVLLSALCVTSCNREDGLSGRKINFVAKSNSYMNKSATKTAYANNGSGASYTERINWVEGDKFTLACAQSSNDDHSFDYLIDSESISASGTYSTAEINPASGNGLNWGANETHYFYGLYPASESMPVAAVRSSVGVTEAGTASAILLSSQEISSQESATSGGITTKSFLPDMHYAYMWCGKSSSPNQTVGLEFNPMFTAFEFSISGEEDDTRDITLNSFTISSSSCALTGAYSGDISISAGVSSIDYTVPECVTSGVNENNRIQITFPANTVINDKNIASFTIFALPASRIVGKTNYLMDLTISFNITTEEGTMDKSLKLKYSSTHPQFPDKYISFPATQKIRIYGLTLPLQKKAWTYTVIEVNAWDVLGSDMLFDQPIVVEPEESGAKMFPGEITVSDLVEEDGGNLS